MRALVLHVRLHDGRYHGQGDWPPSPARLFQALVAGAGLGGPIRVAEKEALEWLEKQKAPLIAAPPAWRPRRGVLFFMPNNDSDAIGGDPLRISKIRTATKFFRPYFFDAAVPFVYAWPLSEADEDAHAREICSLAERLYQFGRGIDMAWAWGEILDDRPLDELLAVYPGRVFRPSAGKSKIVLMSPCPGSLESLECRHQAFGKRFPPVKEGRAVFRRPPEPRFRRVSYDSPPSRQLYELRETTAEARFAPWPLERVSALVVRLRDGAVQRLTDALPARRAEIERVLVGRKPDGTNDGRPEDRVRIIPLPSIGHFHADREIRRVLVEVPPTCPIPATDVHWAFSGLDVADVETGEIQAVLTATDDEEFLCRYGLEDDGRHRVWRTVTPAALPEDARCRRIDPARQRDEAKAGRERAWEQARAAAAVCQALRHAGVRTGAEAIRVQREPFDTNGARVEAFARGTRFAKERLWHVEVRFSESVKGPLVIGDGRFLGLGVMAPVLGLEGVHGFAIESGFSEKVTGSEVVRAFRRAVMARVQETIGDSTSLPPFFSGHEPDGAPAQSERHSHLAFVFDPVGKRLLVVAPHVIDRRAATPDERSHLDQLWVALKEMSELTAGSAGLLKLHRTFVDAETDPLFAVSRHWESVTPYLVIRHARGVTPEEALAADLRAECQRRGLPVPRVVIVEWRGLPRVGLEGRAMLHFDAAVAGPLLLGRSRYKGGGVFRCVPGPQALP
jgi:CRISPR-associated protein Csb2